MPSPWDLTASGPHATRKDGVWTIEKAVDMSEVNGGTGAAQNEVVQVMKIPAGTVVLGVTVIVKVGEESTEMATFTVGDGDDVDGWMTTQSAQAALNVYSGVGNGLTLTEATPNTVAGYQLGKHYTSADTIDIKNTDATTVADGIVRLVAKVMNVTEYMANLATA